MSEGKIVEVRAIMPAMKIEQAIEAFEQYQQLRDKLKKEGDFVTFKTSQGEKEAPTKQWRVKLERFFGLSVEIVERWETKEEDGSITYHKKARVIHPKTGLFHEATGACNTKEKERDGAKKYHNAESHAETRAKNRAVLEFVGFGEVSAEEMESNGNLNSSPTLQEKQTKSKSKKKSFSQDDYIKALMKKLSEAVDDGKIDTAYLDEMIERIEEAKSIKEKSQIIEELKKKLGVGDKRR